MLHRDVFSTSQTSTMELFYENSIEKKSIADVRLCSEYAAAAGL